MSEQGPENERSFDLARFWWVPLIGIPLVITLMLAVRGFVRDVLALPVSQVLWFAELAFKSIPQSICWTALLAIVVVVALKSLGRLSGTSPPKFKPRSLRRGRVTMWADRIELLLNGKYSRHRFGYYIGRLILDVFAHEEQLSYRDIGSRIEQGEFVLPSEVEAYLMARLQPGLPTRLGFFGQLKRLLGFERHSTSPLERELESVIQFLEGETGEAMREGVGE